MSGFKNKNNDVNKQIEVMVKNSIELNKIEADKTNYEKELLRKYYKKDISFHSIEILISILIFLFVVFLLNDSFNITNNLMNWINKTFIPEAVIIFTVIGKSFSYISQLFIPIYIVEVLRILNKKKNCYLFYSGQINTLILNAKCYKLYGNNF